MVWEPGAECGVRYVLPPLQAPGGVQLVEAVTHPCEPPAGGSQGARSPYPCHVAFQSRVCEGGGASCLMFGLSQEAGWGRDPGPQGQRYKGLSYSYSLETVL